MDVENHTSEPPETVELTKAEKLKLKRKARLKHKREAKANKPIKPKPESKMPSSLILPEKRVEVSQFADETTLLTEIKRRLAEQNATTLRLSPIPKKCPPGLLHDLCPTAISVRLPLTHNARFGFLEFKNQLDTQAALKALFDKELDGKKLTVLSCADRVPVTDGSCDKRWKEPSEYTLDDFDLCSLYISRLPRGILRTDLAQVFRTAAMLKLVMLPDGSSRGTCQLRFRSQEKALDAFANLNGTIIKGIPLYINFPIKSAARSQKSVSQLPMKIEKTAKGHPKKRQAPADHDESTNEKSGPAKRARTENVETKNSAGNTEFFSNQKQQPVKKPALPKLQPYQLAPKKGKKGKKVKKPRAK